MAAESSIAILRPDSIQNETETRDTWMSVGDAAARLAAKAEFLPIGESLIDYGDVAEVRE